MTIEELRALLEAAVTRARDASSSIDAIRERVDAAGDDELDAITRELDTALETFRAENAEVARLERNIEVEEQRVAFNRDHPSQPERITAGETHDRTYRRGDGRSFFSDAYRFQRHADPEARERLERHGREVVADMRAAGVEYRDVGTGQFAGLTIPQYLVDLFAPVARAGSPLVNVMRKAPLPDEGMVLSISRGTTGTAVAAQATENAAVQETDFDDTKLDVDVRTYAGQQDVSRQALERSRLVDEIVFGDLVADYFTKLDNACINADGTSGTHLGARSTVGIIAKAYTDASPTVLEFYSAMADAIQQVNKQRFAPASTIIMAPRRWGWLTAAGDSAGRPIVLAGDAGPQNPLAIGDAAAYGNYVGTLHGLPVITDANILENLGTNEDMVLVLRNTDHILFWEGDGMPRQLRFEETAGGNLSVKLVVYGYSAVTFGRYPKGVATVGGTGLITPTFA